MILSYKYRFVFFAVPKTGTHSVRFALRPYLGADDLEQVALFKNSAFLQPDLAAIRHGHLSFLEVYPHFSAELSSFLKFAFVRNPYDRFVSCYFFFTKPSDHSPKANTDAMKRFLNSHLDNKIHLAPQYKFLVDEREQLRLNFVGKVESYQTDLYNLFQKIGLPEPACLTINSSNHLDYRLYYDNELAEMIGSVYSTDFRMFNYSLESYKPVTPGPV